MGIIDLRIEDSLHGVSGYMYITEGTNSYDKYENKK